MQPLTPMMQQYLEMKAQCADALLLFRLGDFYELFMDDALTASQVLEITLTGRDAGEKGRIPMCGVPYHAVDGYIARLIQSGYKVAICEQVEDPKATKGLVKREIVRVVTPGTWMDSQDGNNRYLASIVGQAEHFGVSLLDVGTGEVWYAELPSDDAVKVWLNKWRPVELLLHEVDDWLLDWAHVNDVCCSSSSDTEACPTVLEEQYPNQSTDSFNLDSYPIAAVAVSRLIQYVRATQKSAVVHLRLPKPLQDQFVLQMDDTAIQNLELMETARSRQRKGSLLGLLDDTKTAMGARLLRQWVLRPSADLSLIHERQDAVSEMVSDLFLRESVRSCLQSMYDLDRLTARLSLGSANARDVLALGKTLSWLPGLMDAVAGCQSGLLRRIHHNAPKLDDLADRILSTLVDQPTATVREGGMIRDGVDTLLDTYRSANLEGKTWIAALEARERERTGIKSLKIGFNKVFGYYLEVSKANQHLVPSDYERRQTLASAERFILPEMKEKEALILQAEDLLVEREYEIFTMLRDAVLERLESIQDVSVRIAELDTLQTLAHVAVREHYTRPEVVQERGIEIVAGRHPVVDATMPGSFVPNDVTLTDNRHFLLITGPNMAGKSTYMRQTAQLVLLAHLGSFVPAQSARIGLVDRIFTRIGASDDLARGQSTFMVEMVELAAILREATNQSLVLLDEIGRGTSTYDGLCIAEAVVEALTRPDRSPLTLFATHYHELTQTAERLPGVANLSVLVQEEGMDIRFLHTVVERPADKSYGIQVARLAGLPPAVITRASELLRDRELSVSPGNPHLEVAASVAPLTSASGPPMALAREQSALLGRLCALKTDKMTPLEALNTLHQFVEWAKGESTWD